MDEDGIDAGHLEEDDVAHEGAQQVGIVHGGSPDLDEERLPPEALQVGQGFNQDGGFVFGGQRRETGKMVGPAGAGRGQDKSENGGMGKKDLGAARSGGKWKIH